MSDAETLSVYAEQAQTYANMMGAGSDKTKDKGFQEFTAHLPDGARVLDLGCGPGQYAAAFRDAGYRVDATDAAPEMAKLAREQFGIEVRVEPFEALDATGHYDGIWANFSLLHAPRADFPGHLGRIAQALKPGGTLLLGLKLGTGEHRDSLGRFYAFYTEDELRQMLPAAGLTITNTRHGEGPGLAGDVQPFIVLIAQRPEAP